MACLSVPAAVIQEAMPLRHGDGTNPAALKPEPPATAKARDANPCGIRALCYEGSISLAPDILGICEVDKLQEKMSEELRALSKLRFALLGCELMGRGSGFHMTTPRSFGVCGFRSRMAWCLDVI